MDTLRILLYDMRMDYFNELDFMGWGNAPQYQHTVDKVFEGYFGIQYNHAGSLRVRHGNSPEQLVTGPHVFLTYPDVPFQFGPPPGSPARQHRHHMYVCFRGERVARMRQGGLFPTGNAWSLVPIVHSAEFYEQMMKLLRLLEVGGSRAQMVNLLEGLLLQIQEQAVLARQPGRLTEALDALGQSIRRDPLAEWDFRAQSLSMTISYPHFRRLFQQHFGAPPQQFVLRARLEYAARLLRESHLPIARIADRTGFSDVYHFTRQFKRHMHLPPARYRHEFID